MKACVFLISVLALAGTSSCELRDNNTVENTGLSANDSSNAYEAKTDSIPPVDSTNVDTLSVQRNADAQETTKAINTKLIDPQEVVAFAKTLIGTPYRYASTDPDIGFDCSGFITYVFNHFQISVPRSSIDFTHIGREVPALAALPGDLILFTGTDSLERFVGHMGLVVSNANGLLQFIHSSSGKQHGVTITTLNGYYQSRYMKTIRIFPYNE